MKRFLLWLSAACFFGVSFERGDMQQCAIAIMAVIAFGFAGIIHAIEQRKK